jgi:hypothetical protein
MTMSDDADLERVRRMVEYLRKRHEVEVLEAAEHGLAQADTFGVCPPPLSWHPFYRGKTWLIDWLNGKSDLPEWDIVLPVFNRPMLFTETEPDLMAPTVRTMRMTKRRAWGPAPWVGQPFHYEWNIGTDELGRHIAGESRIVYEDDIWCMRHGWWG